MTPQEQQMIDGLVDRIRNTPVQSKDTEAEQHIQQALRSTPDALYVLVQTVLVQQYGLQQAQGQIDELKQQVAAQQAKLDESAQQPRSSGGSFLSHIFGGGDNSSSSSASQNVPYQPVRNAGYPAPGYPAAAPPPPPAAYPASPYPGAYPAQGGGFFGGGGGGFLQGALQTAAGVAAGEVMFQGMEDLFHGFGRGGERSFGNTGGETVVNNYYDDDRGRSFDGPGRDDSGFYNPDHDASRSDAASGNANDLTQGGTDLGSFGGDAMDFGGSGNDNGNAADDLSFDNSASDNAFNGGGFGDSTGDDFSSDNS